MKNTLHLLGGLTLAIALAACGKSDKSGSAAAPAAGAAPAAAAPAGDQEEIKLTFPKEMFIGTPVPTALPNLEKPDPTKVIKSFMAPKGTVNVAKGKKVTSSDSAPIIGDLTLVTDGDADGADGNFVELMPGKQWVQIDLEKAHDISKIAVWHYHKQAQAYIETNHGRVIDAKGTKARYVRLWSNGNTASDMNHYCEVQVFAVPAK